MHKLRLFSVLLLLLNIGVANAKFIPSQTSSLTKISDIKSLRDDSYVTLEGRIVKQIGSDKFLFQDADGNTIMIDIDQDDMYRFPDFSAKNLLRITGEVDKEVFERTELDVDMLEIIK